MLVPFSPAWWTALFWAHGLARAMANPVISPFPPSFQDGPLNYAAALFGDATATCLCLLIFIYYLSRDRKRRHGQRGVASSKVPEGSLLWAHDRKFKLIAGAFVLRCLPDTFLMLLWGEASEWWARWLFRADYTCDFLAFIPLCMAVMLWTRTREAVAQQLLRAEDQPLPPRVNGNYVQAFKLIAIITLIAIALTIGKASA